MTTFVILIFIVFSVRVVKNDCSCRANRAASNEYNCDGSSKPINSNYHKYNDMVRIEGGKFLMGTDNPIFISDNESPAREVSVDSFYMDKYEISNRKFSEFIKLRKLHKNYQTDAELYGNSFVFDQLICKTCIKKLDEFRVVGTPWWIKVNGVYWKRPFCNHSNIKDIMDHPVVHVSWNDANEYCKFYNKRLPTEAEWEFACRSGLRQKLFSWGNSGNTSKRANVWQGEFPEFNDLSDQYLGTAPVNSFQANNFGVYNLIGNVWEWTQDSWTKNSNEMVKKGGSFLCSKNYCYRYRCAARSQNSKDTTASNIGFRCVVNVEKYDEYFEKTI